MWTSSFAKVNVARQLEYNYTGRLAPGVTIFVHRIPTIFQYFVDERTVIDEEKPISQRGRYIPSDLPIHDRFFPQF